VDKLVENLERKLALFAEQARGPEDAEVAGSFRQICQIEAKCVRPASSTRIHRLTRRAAS
jgi:hypothetical protein